MGLYFGEKMTDSQTCYMDRTGINVISLRLTVSIVAVHTVSVVRTRHLYKQEDNMASVSQTI